MPSISPDLWFDTEAEVAATFYTSLFDDSRITTIARYSEAGPGPEGSVMVVAFQLAGQDFTAVNGGQVPGFVFTPAISFLVYCETPDELDSLWNRLVDGGRILMPLDSYPFSERYGWLEDRFGISWQLMLGSHAQKISPSLMFVGAQHGKAEEAIRHYIGLFENARLEYIERYGPGEGQPEGMTKHAAFSLDGYRFVAMDSGLVHDFTFSPAISFVVNCETQAEVDYFWDRLSEGGATQECGWLSDRYGVTWQIVPTVLGELMSVQP